MRKGKSDKQYNIQSRVVGSREVIRNADGDRTLERPIDVRKMTCPSGIGCVAVIRCKEQCRRLRNHADTKPANEESGTVIHSNANSNPDIIMKHYGINTPEYRPKQK